MTDFSGFPNRLRATLKERKLTQAEVARQLNISKHTLTKYLNGRIPETEIMYRLAHLLNKPIEWLLTGQASTDYLPDGIQGIAYEQTEDGRYCAISQQDRLQHEWIMTFNRFSPDVKVFLLNVLRMIAQSTPPSFKDKT